MVELWLGWGFDNIFQNITFTGGGEVQSARISLETQSGPFLSYINHKILPVKKIETL